MPEKLLTKIGAILEALRMPYMIVGSFASSSHGIPRSTNDLDVVIDPTPEGFAALLEQFPDASYYLSKTAAREALSARGQFNVVEYATGWKVDFILRKASDHGREAFARRSPTEMLGVTLETASPEDTILSKLEWAKLGGSDRQLDDAAGVIRVQGESLDIAYIERWVRVLALDEAWRETMTRAAKV